MSTLSLYRANKSFLFLGPVVVMASPWAALQQRENGLQEHECHGHVESSGMLKVEET